MILLLLDTNHDRPLRSYSLAFNFLRLELFIEIIHLFSARDVASYEFYNFFSYTSGLYSSLELNVLVERNMYQKL